MSADAVCVYVLSSPRLSNKAPDDVAEFLRPFLKLPPFKIPKRRTIAKTLDLFVANIGFRDRRIAASTLETGAAIVDSFDTHFKRIRSITGKEP